MEAIKANYFVIPTVEFQLEDHEAGPMPRLKEDRKARGLATPARLAAHGDGVPQRFQAGALYPTYFVSLDIYIFCTIHWQTPFCG